MSKRRAPGLSVGPVEGDAWEQPAAKKKTARELGTPSIPPPRPTPPPPPPPALALIPYSGGPDAALRAAAASRAALDAVAGPRRLLEDEARLRRAVVAAGWAREGAPGCGGGQGGDGSSSGGEEDAPLAEPDPVARLPSVTMSDVAPGEGMEAE